MIIFLLVHLIRPPTIRHKRVVTCLIINLFFGRLVNDPFLNLKLNVFVINGFVCSNKYVKQLVLINHSLSTPRYMLNRPIVGKGVHNPPFQITPPFSMIPPFLEVQDVPIFNNPIRKRKVLKDLFNRAVYNFYF